MCTNCEIANRTQVKPSEVSMVAIIIISEQLLMYVGSVGTTYRTTIEDFGGFHGNYICMSTFRSLTSPASPLSVTAAKLS